MSSRNELIANQNFTTKPASLPCFSQKPKRQLEKIKTRIVCERNLPLLEGLLMEYGKWRLKLEKDGQQMGIKIVDGRPDNYSANHGESEPRIGAALLRPYLDPVNILSTPVG